MALKVRLEIGILEQKLVFYHSVKARNFQGRKKRAEKFNKNAQKRQISMKELRYAQKLLKGKKVLTLLSTFR